MNRTTLIIILALLAGLSLLGLFYNYERGARKQAQAELKQAQDTAKRTKARIVIRERFRVLDREVARGESLSLDEAIRASGAHNVGGCPRWADQEVPNEVRSVFN
jgi:hypothetical protein